MSGAQEKAYNAAEAIDALLGGDDNGLLAAMAYHKAAMVALFGRDGVTQMLKKYIDGAKVTRFWSARSVNVDRARPKVSLRIDDQEAIRAYPKLGEWLARQGIRNGDLGNGINPRTRERDEAAMGRIISFKTAVLQEEICSPLTDEMNEALRKHWGGAKDRLESMGANREILRMLVGNMFSVGVGGDQKANSRDKMVVLTMFM